ncbi:MAG: hypothetical protein A2Y17_05775 [Clostridiales bacterium GWF2_38_85]|nr:MAG: hypothetical protein A2Y17_05775 [Clostridiales bacterium GWF2_38_85]HBL84009.1 hypothetical protein [Clostridiales bacterium]
MFGYIKPNMGELKVREMELYKSVYCGICVTGGKTVSRLTRFLLSYDFVFMALLRLSLTGEEYFLRTGRCTYNPLRKKRIMNSNEALSYTSAAFAVLTYYKALDDINDSKGIAKLMKYLALPFFKRMKRKAEKLYIDLPGIISEPLMKLSELEKQNEESIDAVADCFGRLMAGILEKDISGAKNRIAKSCGYHMGRYIYILDACDDLDDDIESNNYNPLKKLYKDKNKLSEDFILMDTTLTDSMNAFMLSYSLCEEENIDIYNIIENIAFQGTKIVQYKVLNKKEDCQ